MAGAGVDVGGRIEVVVEVEVGVAVVEVQRSGLADGLVAGRIAVVVDAGLAVIGHGTFLARRVGNGEDVFGKAGIGTGVERDTVAVVSMGQSFG